MNTILASSEGVAPRQPQAKRVRQKHADVRVCASCSWLFRRTEADESTCGCPKCGFAHYGARYVFGPKCYRYEVTQEPWMEKKLADYTMKLHQEIAETCTRARERRTRQAEFLLETD